MKIKKQLGDYLMMTTEKFIELANKGWLVVEFTNNKDFMLAMNIIQNNSSFKWNTGEKPSEVKFKVNNKPKKFVFFDTNGLNKQLDFEFELPTNLTDYKIINAEQIILNRHHEN